MTGANELTNKQTCSEYITIGSAPCYRRLHPESGLFTHMHHLTDGDTDTEQIVGVTKVCTSMMPRDHHLHTSPAAKHGDYNVVMDYHFTNSSIDPTSCADSDVGSFYAYTLRMKEVACRC